MAIVPGSGFLCLSMPQNAHLSICIFPLSKALLQQGIQCHIASHPVCYKEVAQPEHQTDSLCVG